MGRRRLLTLLVLPALLLEADAARVPAGPAPPASLTPKQRREVGTLVTRFRRAEDEAARTGAVDGLLKVGPGGAAALLDAVNKQIDPLMRRYRADLLEATRRVLRRRVKDREPEELESLQQKVTSLSRDGGLTKEKIKAQGDPALEELQHILIVPSEDVLQANPDLKRQRERLLALGRHWQRATDYLAEHAPAATEALPDTRPFTDILRDHEALSALLAIARTDSHRRILIKNADLTPRIRPEEARGIRRLNQIRILAGLKPLKIDVELCRAARDHSKDMVEKDFFAHESPVAGKRTVADRAKRFGTTAHAENIARGSPTGAGAIRQWWYSPGHHKNMMGSHSRVGLGRHQKTWTQMFG